MSCARQHLWNARDSGIVVLSRSRLKVSVVPSGSEQLRSAGLRVTRPRLAVLAEVAERPHADVVAIASGVRARLGSLSTQAAYDVLYALTDAGLLRRIEPAGSTARFELRTGDNHHHLVCRSCGVIADVDCATGAAPCLHASDEAGYLIDEAEVTFWGLCPQCRPGTINPTSGDAHEHIRIDTHPRPAEAGPAHAAGR